jgi:hypothetical protein
MGIARAGAALTLVLAVAGCAQRAGGTPPSSEPSVSTAARLPEDPDALVLRVEYTGGFVTPETTAGRLPIASVYGDGRVIVEGPVPAIYPGYAWPNVQVLEIGRDGVQGLADSALAAGVAETADLGTPPLADVPSTRFTLTTASGTHVREVYGLNETTTMPDSGLTEAQQAARRELLDLFTAVTDLAVSEAGDEPPLSYTPTAVAAIVRLWTASEEDVAHGLVPEAVAWPGPALPGDPVGRLPSLTCVTVIGTEAATVVAAARDANTLTPWLSPDGVRWSVLFRPLLPDEAGCADLGD